MLGQLDVSVLIDFLDPPENYEPATIAHYRSRFARFVGKISTASDIWALGCTLFENHTGRPLFGDFLGGDDEILKEIVVTLGRLPDPMWEAFEGRLDWFDEGGNPKSIHLQTAMLPARKTSIQLKLEDIGVQDEPLASGDGSAMMGQD